MTAPRRPPRGRAALLAVAAALLLAGPAAAQSLPEIDRKVLSDLAIREPAAFKSLVDQAKAALA